MSFVNLLTQVRSYKLNDEARGPQENILESKSLEPDQRAKTHENSQVQDKHVVHTFQFGYISDGGILGMATPSESGIYILPLNFRNHLDLFKLPISLKTCLN